MKPDVRPPPFLRTSSFAAILCLILVAHAAAESTFTTLHHLVGVNGYSPQAGLSSKGMTLYGAAIGGGLYGSGILFSLDTTNNLLTPIHSLSPPDDGFLIATKLTIVNSLLYGTAAYGGASNTGTLFSFNLDTHSFAALHHFSPAQYSSSQPASTLIAVGEVLYGTTQGNESNGSIFAFNTTDSTLTTLLEFSGADGAEPSGAFLRSGSLLYGTTFIGGENNCGTIYKFDLETKLLITVHNFSTGEAARPNGNLLQFGSTLVGTAHGLDGFGVIYRFDLATNGLEILHHFTGADGATPGGELLAVGQIIYGTTAGGGASNAGTVYSFNLASGVLSTLHHFDSVGGATPYAGLARIGSTLYGTTYAGGIGYGTIFSVRIAEPTSGWIALVGIGAVIVMVRNFGGSGIEVTG